MINTKNLVKMDKSACSNRRNIYPLLLYRALTSFGASLYKPFFSLYFLALGGTPFLLGLTNSLSSLIILLLNFYGGYLADKYGNKIVLGSLIIVTHVFVALYSMAWSWQVLTLLIILATLFCWYGPALSSLMAAVFRPRERSLGYQLMNMVGSGTKLFTSLLAGLLVDALGVAVAVRMGSLIAGVLGIVSGLAIMLLIKDYGIPDSSVKNGPVKDKESVFQSYGMLIKETSKEFIAVILLANIVLFAYSMTGPYLVLYSMDKIGLSGLQWGFIITVNRILLTVAIMPLTGLLVTKLGEYNCFLTSSIVLIASTALFLQSGGLVSILLAYILLNTASNISRPAIFSYWTSNTKSSDRGKFASLVSLFEGVLVVPAPLIGGRLYQLNPTTLFIVAMLTCLLATLILLLLRTRLLKLKIDKA